MSRLVWGLPSLAVLAMVAGGLALAVYRFPPPSIELMLAGSLAVGATLSVAIARYDFAVGLGFLLLGVVKVEPAPSDMIFAVTIAAAAVTGRFDPTRVPIAVLGTLGAFLVVNVLSAMGAIAPIEAGFYLSITLYLAVFSVWLAGYVNSNRRARIIVACYLAAAVVSGVLGTSALFVAFPGSDDLLLGEDRAKGLFKDANVYGPFMIPMILILLEEILQPRLLRLKRPIKVALLLILFISVLFAFSRAGYLNLIVSVVVLLSVLTMRRGGGSRALALLAVLVAGALAVAVTLSVTGETAFLEERTQIQQYDTGRFGAQRDGIALATENPLGIGPGQFDVISPLATHSSYVRTLAEQGYLGLMSFLALVVGTLLLAGRNVASGRSTYGIGSAALLAAWCGILANSFFIDSLHWRHLWIVAALIWAGSMSRSSHSQRI